MDKFDITNRIIDTTVNELLKLIGRSTKDQIHHDTIMKNLLPMVLDILIETGYSIDKENELFYKFFDYRIQNTSMSHLEVGVSQSSIGLTIDSFLDESSDVLDFFEYESYITLLDLLDNQGMVGKIAILLIYKAYMGRLLLNILYHINN